MKSAVFIGNCQGGPLMRLLRLSDEFSNTFTASENISNWKMIKENSNRAHQRVKTADLFIYQPLMPVHGVYSTDPTVPGSLMTLTKEDCISISYPYIVFAALWPIWEDMPGNNTFIGGKILEKLKNEGFNVFALYDQDKLDWRYDERTQETLAILRKKELMTDVKIADFIQSNLSLKKLFWTPRHPTLVVMLEVANQILKILKMDPLAIGSAKLQQLESEFGLNRQKYPIHKSAIDHYGLLYGAEDTQHAKSFYRDVLERCMARNAKLARAAGVRGDIWVSPNTPQYTLDTQRKKIPSSELWSKLLDKYQYEEFQ